MLSNMDKMSIVRATVYNRNVNISVDDLEEAIFIRNRIVSLKSKFGYGVNYLYDKIIEESGDDYVEFTNKVHSLGSEEHMALMLFHLYNKVGIEELLNDYVIKNAWEELNNG